MFAVAVHTAINKHDPIDLSADWEDWDAQLPKCSIPRREFRKDEIRTRLRRLLLHASRRSVSLEIVEALSQNDAQSRNEQLSPSSSNIERLGVEVSITSTVPPYPNSLGTTQILRRP